MEILREERRRRREENQQALVYGPDATAQPRIHPEYEADIMKLILNTLVPLAKKPFSEMRPQDWRALQVTIDTEGIPPEDYISLAQSTSNIVYYKYMKAASSSEELQNKFSKASTNMKLLNATVKALDI